MSSVNSCVVSEPLEARVFLSAAPHKPDAAPAGGDAQIYAPHSTVRGLTLGEWAAEWTKWALSAPASANPITDTTGQFANANQPKGVFLLAGTFGGAAPVTRNVTVPTGTPLFFPVLNDFWVNVDVAVPGVYPVPDPPFAGNEAAIRADFKLHTDAYTNMVTTVDGVAVDDLASHVELSPPGGIAIDFPQDNVLGVPPEILGLAATGGVYLMVGPLAPGAHEIHFAGTDPLFGTSLDVTYDLTVVPKGQYRQDQASPAPAAGHAFSDTPVRKAGSVADGVL